MLNKMFLLSGKKRIPAPIRLALSGGVSRSNLIGCYDALYASSQTDSYINLAKPGTNNLSVVGSAPAWDKATGWQWSSDTLDTGIIPSSTNWSVVVQVAGLETGVTKGILGARSSTDAASFFLLKLNTGIRAYNGAASPTATPEFTDGTYSISGKNAYRNGVLDSVVNAGGGPPVHSLYIGAYNNGGVATVNLTQGYIKRVYFYNVVLTAEQVLAIHAAINP